MTEGTDSPVSAGPAREPTGVLLRRFLKTGLLSFGGPAAQLEQMRTQYVTAGLVPEATLARAISFCSILPGPESQQVATYLGWRVAGLWGAIAASTLYIVPGWAMVTLASALYVTFGQSLILQGIALGLRSAVVALLADSLLRQARRAWLTPAVLWLTVASIGLRLASVPFPLVMVGALVLGVALPLREPPGKPVERTPIRWSHVVRDGVVALALWALPLLAVLRWAGPESRLGEVTQAFGRLAVTTWGGAYAVINVVIDDAVHHGWVTATQMVDGLGLAESSPGPLLLALCFVGFISVGAGSATPVVSGLIGSAVSAWCLFMPSIVWVVVGAPVAEWLTQNPRVDRAARFIAAAALGVIALVAVFIMRQVVWPDGASLALQWPVLVTVVVCLLVHFTRRSAGLTLGSGVLLGLALHAMAAA